MANILYVYAIARAEHPLPERVEAIDGSDVVDVVTTGELSAFVTPFGGLSFIAGWIVLALAALKLEEPS